MSKLDPSLEEVIDSHVKTAMERLRVAMPALVESYDPATRLASVVPQLQRPTFPADGTTEWISLPRVNNVPVLMPYAAGRLIKLPVQPKDIVLLVFCDFSLDRWKGGAGATDPQGVVQPSLLAAHRVADAIAIPGFLNPVKDSPHTAVEVQTDGTVLLGEGASQGVGLGHALRTELDAIWSVLLKHQHDVVGVTAGTATVAATSAGATGAIPSVASKDALATSRTPSTQVVESGTVKTAS